MERTKYDEEYVRKLSNTKTSKEIAEILNVGISKLQKYCWRHNIKCKDYHEKYVRKIPQSPIGTEYVKPDGMTLVKISNNKWEYKQRYIYEQYYNVELPTSKMVIFLDQDRNNFDINNLMVVDKREMNYVQNKHIIGKDRDLNELALLNARLDYKTKEVK